MDYLAKLAIDQGLDVSHFDDPIEKQFPPFHLIPEKERQGIESSNT